jgi:hypothetical protein
MGVEVEKEEIREGESEDGELLKRGICCRIGKKGPTF